ncbi:type I-E CRISPR-associated protein Cas5/CasD [Undibacterium sp. SXout7W]|uniref:type I-E CRISPR-associated protein Cas5/CasD n=1 Tax=Undibacterium sp. SXout7W TaxID=3413049 RepID=UPI003BF2FFE8
METLIFQLQGTMAAWGEVAVGEYRPSADYPGQSAIDGLLAAALGIDRDDHAAHMALCNSYRIAIGVVSTGRLLRDYHTAQVPGRTDLKKRPHATRRDELSLPKQDLNTILSTRDYRQDASVLVAVQAYADAPYTLVQLAEALKKPRFILYLGRKSCPVAAPLHPCILDASTVATALSTYQQQLMALWQKTSVTPPAGNETIIQKIVWGDDFGTDDLATMGVLRDFSITRKDQLITRQGWLFADRSEHIALMKE